jgi:rfaE bifunctional protein kinase chain/domain
VDSAASLTRYRRLIARFPRVRLAVAGDLIADEFIYGRVERVSREAPVLILRYDSTEILPGGAGNAASNVASLGARVELIGVAGTDEPGRRLLASLPPRVSARGIIRAAGYVTPVKTRILAGGVHSAKQQIVRIDKAGGAARAAIVTRAQAAVARALSRADALIVSDYGGGIMTPESWQRARRAAKAAGRKLPIVVVDSRYALSAFRGMTACTPNQSEVEALLGIRIDDDRSALERAGRQLLDRLETQAVLITRGSRGMALFERGKPTDHIPIVGSDQIADVTGAGDTVIATFTLALAAGATFGEAARLANCAGGIVVMKRGTATVSAKELTDAVRDN